MTYSANRWEPRKEDFLSIWGKNGYRENFDVYERPECGGASENYVVSHALSPYYNKGHICLEIGCGGGYWPENHLCKNFKHVFGIDLVPYVSIRPGNFTYIEAPSRSYDCYGIEDSSVDFIWSFGVFCHIARPSIEKYLLSAHRVLKSGGNVSFYFPCADRRPAQRHDDKQESGILWEYLTRQDSIDMMNRAGFIDVDDPCPNMRDLMLTGRKQ